MSPKGSATLAPATTNPRASRSDEAHDRLREEILRGEIRPNERLIEVELAERFDISRTPIREVLQRLGTEGLIVRVRRGWRVREHSADEIGEIYEARAALEGYAAGLAAERGTAEELARIRAIHEDEDSSEPRTAREHLVEINDAFHQAILDAAHNARLTELARQSREYYFNYRIASLYSDSEAEASVEQHEAIVRELLARDAPAAEAAVRAHVLQALELIRAKLR
jgi:DNA-binding GntR family transcriptional regulator